MSFTLNCPSTDNDLQHSKNGNGSQFDPDDVVTPWTVLATSSKGVDYDKLIERFGCRKLTEDLVTRIENLTGKRAHAMLRRGLFFAHRRNKWRTTGASSGIVVGDGSDRPGGASSCGAWLHY
uniref:Tryptophanyl-tRNA synthetase n=1 Tax=Globodera pallida TaxID=36090 RepID=A0A183BLQ5_GLOPA